MASQVSNGALRAALSAAAAPRLTDRELLAQFSAGNQAAFAAIVKRHTGLVLGVCRRVLPTVQDAEDACQAVFLVLARKAKTGGWQSSIANWLYTTARRIASETNRAAARRLNREAHSTPPAPVSALDEMTGREAFAALDEELDKLPAIYREPLVLCYLQGLTRDEAASRLGIPSATLKSQLDRGRKKLADALTKRGIDIGAGLITVAATSSASASSRLMKTILAAVGGSPSAPVAAIVQTASVNGFALKGKLLVLAAIAVAVTGFGLASMQIAPGPQRAVVAKQSATKESPKSDSKSKAEQPMAKVNDLLKFKPIDPETIGAYEKLGAHYGGFEISPIGREVLFGLGKDVAAKNLPGFYLPSLPALPENPVGNGVFHDGQVLKLPPVKVPFGLHLSGTHVTNAALERLVELNNLCTLNLDHTPVTDAGLRTLKGLSNLSELRLNFTQVTDAGLSELKALKNLSLLELGNTKVTDAGLKELRDFASLDLNSTQVTDAGLKTIKENSHRLATLNLRGTRITDTGMTKLKGLKNLTWLNLGDTQVTDVGLKELKELKNLKTLNLHNTKVTDASLQELKELKNLTVLDLSDTKVTGAGLKEFINLAFLQLDQTQVADAGLKEIKELKNLKSIWLRATQVTDAGLKEIKELKNLDTLVLNSTQVTDAGLQELKELKCLTSLDLGSTKVTRLKDLNNLKKLVGLYLGGAPVTDAGLKEIKDLERVIALGLEHTKVTDAGLKDLKLLTKLTYVDLTGANVTTAGVKELKAALPNCQIRGP